MVFQGRTLLYVTELDEETRTGKPVAQRFSVNTGELKGLPTALLKTNSHRESFFIREKTTNSCSRETQCEPLPTRRLQGI